MKTIHYNVQDLPNNFTAELSVPENEEYQLAITGDTLCAVSYTITARLANNAKLTVKDSVTATASYTAHLAIFLEGAGASVHDISRYYGDKSAAFTIERVVVHTGIRTASCMTARGVLNGEARSFWRGRIHIEKSAEKAQAFQQHDALLVSSKAYVDASPILEINTNDIQCRHRASVQRINPEHVFYMAHRGIDERAARQALVDGFLAFPAR
jgi:Fe-S cluster assembly protein SufD